MTQRWYTWNHEWFEVVECGGNDGGKVQIRCGLAPAFFAGASELVGIELPTVGDIVKADDSIGMIEFSKAVFELRTLLDGEIVHVNAAGADITTLPDTLFELRCDEQDFQRLITDVILIDTATYESQIAANEDHPAGGAV